MTVISLPITNIELLQELIPHRNPMLMINTLYLYMTDRIEAGLHLSENNLFIQEGLFLEAGIIENMAQTVALHTGYSFFLKNEKAPIGYLGAIKKISIEQLPKLGDQIITKAQIIHEFMGVTLVEVETFLQDRCIARAEIKTVLAS